MSLETFMYYQAIFNVMLCLAVVIENIAYFILYKDYWRWLKLSYAASVMLLLVIYYIILFDGNGILVDNLALLQRTSVSLILLNMSIGGALSLHNRWYKGQLYAKRRRSEIANY